jgi:hypothetical protein
MLLPSFFLFSSIVSTILITPSCLLKSLFIFSLLFTSHKDLLQLSSVSYLVFVITTFYIHT